MTEFQPLASYGPAVDQLLRAAPAMAVGTARPQGAQLELATAEEALSRSLDASQRLDVRAAADADMAQCCCSALWLRFGWLDESHAISQNIATPEGSYWHGIMHRHEPDDSNAKYWFRKVGRHALFSTLGPLAAVAIRQSDADLDFARQGDWDPFQFVDLCQTQAAAGGPALDTMRQLIELEWSVLFDYCYRRAAGEHST